MFSRIQKANLNLKVFKSYIARSEVKLLDYLVFMVCYVFNDATVKIDAAKINFYLVIYGSEEFDRTKKLPKDGHLLQKLHNKCPTRL